MADRAWLDAGARGVMSLSRRDRYAMQLALEALRYVNELADIWKCNDAYASLDKAMDALSLGRGPSDRILSAVVDYRSYDPHNRIQRCRLALLLRAMLRADRGDYGPREWVGCTCHCDGVNGGWQFRRYVPLWDLARPHG